MCSDNFFSFVLSTMHKVVKTSGCGDRKTPSVDGVEQAHLTGSPNQKE